MEISASGRVDLTNDTGTIHSRLVHAISVAQPVQSWTVLREHDDFITLGNVVSSAIAGIPSCPAAPTFDPSTNQNDVDLIVRVRNATQNWLCNILLFPGARESNAVRHFLCYGANHVAPQYQGMVWVPFRSTSTSSNTTSSTMQNHSHAGSGSGSGSQSHNHNHHHIHHNRGEAEELEMDEMFVFGDGPADDDDEHEPEEEDYEDDDAEYFSAAERYHPREEAVTHDDVMDFQNNVDDVEMIEDVGSLAQSLGASHLGRSLQLQAELAAGRPNHNGLNNAVVPPQQGLTIGGVTSNNSSTTSTGGIGNAVQNASSGVKVEGLSDSFYQKKPISAPKLDSFRMIKVVGKGSFGKMIH